MAPAKPGGQDVGVGHVFVEITEKAWFPGFRFFRRVEFGAWQRQKKAPGKNCASEDQDLGVCDMLKPNPEAKMEILGLYFGALLIPAAPKVTEEDALCCRPRP